MSCSAGDERVADDLGRDRIGLRGCGRVGHARPFVVVISRLPSPSTGASFDPAGSRWWELCSSMTSGPANASPGRSRSRCSTVGIDCDAGERRAARARHRVERVRPGRGRGLRRRRCGRRPASRRLDELHRGAGSRMPVPHAVGVVERLVEPRQIDVAADRHVHGVLLAHVAHVGRTSEVVVTGPRCPRMRAARSPSDCSSMSTSLTTLALELGERPVEAAAPHRGGYRSAACPRQRTCPGSTARSPRRYRAPAASQTACIGPAPPNATREKSRGSMPCLT